jgi:kumamolisin
VNTYLQVLRIVAIASVCTVLSLGYGRVLASPATDHQVLHRAAVTHQPLSGYSPQQIATAYDFTPLYARGVNGSGQTVALIEVDGLRPTAVHRFDKAYNLPDPTVTTYYVGGRKFATEQQAETTIDVEWLHALAPGAAIQVYYLPNDQTSKASWQTMAAALRLAAANGATTVSISLGTCGPTKGYKMTAAELAALTKQGVSVFVASGDNGDRPGPVRQCGRRIGVSYPASDPSVVAVGGTSLQLNVDNTIANEIGWYLSGGGVAKKFARPLWQSAPGLPSDNHRWIPDVSFLGDPTTGVNVYFRGKWLTVGGTSLGAPAWAAAWALVRESVQQAGQTVGAAPGILYRIANSPAYTSAFHDITEGSNGTYTAGPGWDPVTGLGTPDVANLTAAVQALVTTKSK